MKNIPKDSKSQKINELLDEMEKALRTLRSQYCSLGRIAFDHDFEKDGNPYVKEADAVLKKCAGVKAS